MHPFVTSVLGRRCVHCPQAVQVQFRYAFVCDGEGVKVLDVTDLQHPKPISKLGAARGAQHLSGPHVCLRGRRQFGVDYSRHHES